MSYQIDTTETEELIETADKIHLFFEKTDSWGSTIYAYVYQESGYPIGEVILTWNAADGVRYYKIACAYGATSVLA